MNKHRNPEGIPSQSLTAQGCEQRATLGISRGKPRMNTDGQGFHEFKCAEGATNPSACRALVSWFPHLLVPPRGMATLPENERDGTPNFGLEFVSPRPRSNQGRCGN